MKRHASAQSDDDSDVEDWFDMSTRDAPPEDGDPADDADDEDGEFVGEVHEIDADRPASFALEDDADDEPVGGDVSVAAHDTGMSDPGGATQVDMNAGADNAQGGARAAEAADALEEALKDVSDDDGSEVSDEEDRCVVASMEEPLPEYEESDDEQVRVPEHLPEHVPEHVPEHISETSDKQVDGKASNSRKRKKGPKGGKGKETPEAPKPPCAVCTIDDGTVRSCGVPASRLASKLFHARFEVPNDVAVKALREDKLQLIAVCQAHYMDSQNGKREKKSEPRDYKQFEGEPVARKRLCRLCRTYRYLVGSCNGSRYGTDAGFVIHTAFRGLNPAPLVELPPTPGDDGRDAIFVCFSCMHKYAPIIPPKVGRPKKNTDTPAGDGQPRTTKETKNTKPAPDTAKPAPDTAALDEALRSALQARSTGKENAQSSKDRITEEARQKGIWLAKLARRSKTPAADAAPLDVTWAHFALVAFVQGVCIDNIDVQAQSFGRTLYHLPKRGIHLVLRVLFRFPRPLDLLRAPRLSSIFSDLLHGARQYALETARALVQAAETAVRDGTIGEKAPAQALNKHCRRTVAAANALRADPVERTNVIDVSIVDELRRLYARSVELCSGEGVSTTISEVRAAVLRLFVVLVPLDNAPLECPQPPAGQPGHEQRNQQETNPLRGAQSDLAAAVALHAHGPPPPSSLRPLEGHMLEGQRVDLSPPSPPPPTPPLVGETQGLTLYGAALISAVERSSPTDVLDAVARMEQKLLGPLTPSATTTILPSQKGTATSDAGVTAAVEAVFNELTDTAIVIGADQPLFERLAKLRAAGVKSGAKPQWQRTVLLLGFFHTSWAAMRALMHAASGFGLHALAHLVGVVYLDPFDRSASFRASEAALRATFLAVLRSLCVAHQGCRTLEELIACAEERGVVHGVLAHLSRVAVAWMALQRGVRLANWELQLAGMRALAAIFADLGRSQYAMSTVRFLSQERLDELAGIHTLHRRAGHGFALDEALETFGVRVAKQELDGVPTEQLLLDVIATIEGEKGKANELLEACGLPYVDPARASKYCEQAMREGIARLTRELDEVLALPGDTAREAPLLCHAPSFRDPSQVRALSSLFVQGAQRAHKLWKETIVSPEEKAGKGRRASSLRCFVAKKQTGRNAEAAARPFIRKVELLVKQLKYAKDNAAPEQQAAFDILMRTAADAVPYPPMLANPLSGARNAADKSTVLERLPDQSFWLSTQEADEYIAHHHRQGGNVIAATDGTQLLYALLAVHKTAWIDFDTIENAFVSAIRSRMGRHIRTMYICLDALALVPPTKSFEQADRDGHDDGARERDALLLNRPLDRIDVERFRANRQLRQKLAAAIVQELIRRPPQHLGNATVYVDVPTDDGQALQTVKLSTLASSRQQCEPQRHQHGEADLSTTWHLARAVAAQDDSVTLAVAFIHDIDAVVLALCVAASLVRQGRAVPHWLVAFRHIADNGKWCDIRKLCTIAEQCLPFLAAWEAIASFAFCCILGGNDYKEAAPLAPSRLLAFYLTNAQQHFGSLVKLDRDAIVLRRETATKLLLAAILERNGKPLPAHMSTLTGELVAVTVREAVPSEEALALSVARAAVTARYYMGAVTSKGLPLEAWVEEGTGFCRRDARAPLGPDNVAIDYGHKVDGTACIFPPPEPQTSVAAPSTRKARRKRVKNS